MKMLLDRNASISSPYGEIGLLFSVEVGDHKNVQVFLDRGVNVNAEIDLDSLTSHVCGLGPYRIPLV